MDQPIVAFVIGVVVAEMWQWGAWRVKHSGNGWGGYWRVGIPHLMMNLTGDVLVAALWSAGLLDDWINWAMRPIPGLSAWANVGLPYTPQLGLVLGILSDLFSDNLAFVIRKVLSKRLPGTFGDPTPPAGG